MLGREDKFLIEAHRESPISIVPNSPTPTEGQDGPIPLASLENGEGMREVVQLLTRMDFIHERQLEARVHAEVIK